MTEVGLRPEAEADLLEIALHIAQDSPARAQRAVWRLRERCRILEDWPLVGRARPELGDDLRSLVEWPYVVVYRVDSGVVEIVAFLHGARDLPRALAARLKEE